MVIDCIQDSLGPDHDLWSMMLDGFSQRLEKAGHNGIQQVDGVVQWWLLPLFSVPGTPFFGRIDAQPTLRG